MPGRSTSGFYRPDRHCLHQSQSDARWCERKGVSETKRETDVYSQTDGQTETNMDVNNHGEAGLLGGGVLRWVGMKGWDTKMGCASRRRMFRRREGGKLRGSRWKRGGEEEDGGRCLYLGRWYCINASHTKF